MNKSKLKKITSARLFLPIVCLIAVLLLNVIRTPDFFNVSIRNGVLYGYIVDVINRASELVILAIGMTLVTAASGGQDISVGAIIINISIAINLLKYLSRNKSRKDNIRIISSHLFQHLHVPIRITRSPSDHQFLICFEFLISLDQEMYSLFFCQS